ncbi:MAG: M24 family metallopeptidase [Variovorax sp.]
MPEPDLGVPKFSLEERERRWTRVRSLMARDDIDAIFAPPNTGLFDMFQANVRYLTGLGGNHCMVAAVFPREGEVTAVSSPDVHKSIWLQRQDWVDDIRSISAGWGFTGEAVARLKELGNIKRLGVTGLSGNTRFPEGVTSHGIVERLRQALPDVELVNVNALMEEARFVKSEEEIAFLQAGVVLVERAIDILAAEARPGVPENVVYAHMIASIVEGGGELPSMILWSAGWPQPPSNAYMPTRRPLQQGDMILTEAEARWGGYVAQNTQPLFIGKAPTEYRDMFARQQEAIALIYDLLRPGETLGRIAARVAEMSDDRFDCVILMHGRGLGDDSPLAVFGVRDAVMANWVIEKNSAFIIKPVVSNKDGTKRIYWGDTVVCTPNGARRLGKRAPSILEVG